MLDPLGLISILTGPEGASCPCILERIVRVNSAKKLSVSGTLFPIKFCFSSSITSLIGLLLKEIISSPMLRVSLEGEILEMKYFPWALLMENGSDE